MRSSKMATLALGTSAAFSLAGATAAHAQQITIGVAANFGNAVKDLVDDFSFSEGGSASFTFVVDSTGVLRTCIQTPSTATNFSTNCPFGHYDLFLAADNTTPATVAGQGMTFSPTTTTPAQPFFYATGSLELYSPLTGTDISAGLPETSTLPPPALVIASPSAAPYGFAAMTVINTFNYTNIGTLTTGSSYPVANLIFTESNIGNTFNAIKNGSFQYGFVHKSAICQNLGSGEVFNDGHGANQLFHREYLFSDATHGYGQIIQTGIPIELGQSSDVKQEVFDFVSYLQSDGKGIIESYCYGTTNPNP